MSADRSGAFAHPFGMHAAPGDGGFRCRFARRRSELGCPHDPREARTSRGELPGVSRLVAELGAHGGRTLRLASPAHDGLSDQCCVMLRGVRAIDRA